MRKIKKIILMLVLTVMTTCLTACGAGATVNTTLTINQDLSGIRTMQMVFAESTFDEYFSGSIDDLNATIGENIPAELTYDYTSSNGNYYYQFHLAFSSVDDYISKVNSITGGEYNVTISCPDSIWVNGVYVEENFTSSTLLQWLSDALVEKGQLSSSYVSNIFGTGDTLVVFNGSELTSSSQIYVDQIEYQKIDSIEVLTDINALDNYDRTVKFIVPNNTMINKGEQITAYMNSVIPENATLDVLNNENSTEFVYTGVNLSGETLAPFMESIFGADNVLISNECVDEIYSPFTFSEYINEQIGLGNYVLGNVSTEYYYYVKLNDNSLQCSATNPLLNSEIYIPEMMSEKYPEYILLDGFTYYGSDTYPIGNDLLIQRIYFVDDVEVSMKKGITSEWTREIEFILSAIPSDEEIEQIKDKILGKYEISTENTSELEGESEDTDESLNSEQQIENAEGSLADTEEEETEDRNIDISTESGEAFSVIIEEKGTLDEIGTYEELLFGAYSDISYTTENGLFKFNKLRNVSDRINLGNYTQNKTPEYLLTYTLTLGPGAEIMDCNLMQEEYTLESGKLQYETYGDSVYVSVLYKSVDIWSVLFVLFILATIILFILAAIKSDLIHVKKISIRLPEKNIKVEQVDVGNGSFCTECGNVIPEGNLFCDKCGHKVEE